MKLALLVPGPFDTVSGGYIYDRRIMEGLRGLGHAVEGVELAGRHPLPDDAAEEAARAALAGLPGDAQPIIDGLGLPAFAPLADDLVRRRAIGLIHHPTALEHGAPQEDREALRGIERDLFPRLARLIATSPHTAERLTADFAVPAERIGIVEPGTDPAGRAQGSGGPGVAILAVGTLVPRKGHDVLLRSLAGLPDLNWTLTIAGGARDAVHAHGLKALAEELGVARRVRFAGELSAEALEAEYRRA